MFMVFLLTDVAGGNARGFLRDCFARLDFIHCLDPLLRAD